MTQSYTQQLQFKTFFRIYYWNKNHKMIFIHQNYQFPRTKLQQCMTDVMYEDSSVTKAMNWLFLDSFFRTAPLNLNTVLTNRHEYI